jgi:hypothetical protein
VCRGKADPASIRFEIDHYRRHAIRGYWKPNESDSISDHLLLTLVKPIYRRSGRGEDQPKIPKNLAISGFWQSVTPGTPVIQPIAVNRQIAPA